jgi:flagellar motility protein MotE (MotC chaperone)
MRIASLIVAAALTAPAFVPAAAQDAGRYTLERTDEGYVRMDRRSGEMSLCQERDGQLICRLAADERSALQAEVDRLQSELDRLEERVDALEGGPAAALSEEDEFEQALTFMERFFRRFMDIVKDLERDFGGEEAEPGTPQRT